MLVITIQQYKFTFELKLYFLIHAICFGTDLASILLIIPYLLDNTKRS